MAILGRSIAFFGPNASKLPHTFRVAPVYPFHVCANCLISNSEKLNRITSRWKCEQERGRLLLLDTAFSESISPSFRAERKSNFYIIVRHSRSTNMFLCLRDLSGYILRKKSNSYLFYFILFY